MFKPILGKLIKILVIAGLFVFGSIIKGQDLKVEEIISKHLDSIAPKEQRDLIKNRMAFGLSEFESKLPSRKTGGKVVIISEGNNVYFVSSFLTENYPYEKIGFFAGKVDIPFVVLGTRSPLGMFISDHHKSLSDGIFTGSISTNWNLLNTQKRGTLATAGTKKINGRKAYVLNYYESGNSASFTTKLFFDAETFRHIRTEYRDVISPKDAKFGVLGEESTTGIETILTEEFSEFKNANGLTLPHLYKIYYMTASNNGVFEYNWNFKISLYEFNRKYAPDFFSFSERAQ